MALDGGIIIESGCSFLTIFSISSKLNHLASSISSVSSLKIKYIIFIIIKNNQSDKLFIYF